MRGSTAGTTRASGEVAPLPSRELVCKNEVCPAYRPVASMTADEVLHCECGGRLEIVIYALKTSWVGPISAKYLDRSKEGGNKADGGHWVWDKETKPGKGAQSHYITTWQEQRDYVKRNNLVMPSDMPSNFEVGQDGKTILNTCGMPGTEV